MADILPVFAALIPSPRDGVSTVSYYTSRIGASGHHFIAKSEEGYPVLLIETRVPVGSYPAVVKLENLAVMHGYAGTMKTPDGEQTGVFSLIECRVTDEVLVASFLRLSSHLLNGLPEVPEPQAVAFEVRKLVQIFQALRHPPAKSIQGLWAELFVLATSPDIPRWAAAWHDDPIERFDFAMQRVRVEVKSSGNRMRRHHFSHEQLHPPSGIQLWVASVYVERSTGGSDCVKLLRQIQACLPSCASFDLEAKVIRTLGPDYSKAGVLTFDDELAKESLSFIPGAQIPRVPDDLPAGVSDLHYTVLIPSSVDSQRHYPSF